MTRPRSTETSATAILTLGAAFLAQHSRIPVPSECRDYGLPHHKTISQRFGTFAKFQYLVSQGIKDADALMRRCLKCEETFFPIPDDARVCDPCKQTDEWQDDGLTWACGYTVTPLTLTGGRRVGMPKAEEWAYSD